MNGLRLKSYWGLFKALMFPVNVLKVILVVIIFFYFLFLLSILIFKGYFDPALPVLVIFAALYLFFIGILSPNQVLAMASSKHTRYLADIRIFYLGFYFLYVLLMTVLVSIVKMQKEEWLFNPLFSVSIWIMITTVLVVQFLVVLRFPQAIGLVFIAFTGIQFLLDKLMQLPIGLLLAAGALIWLVCSAWWLRWKPKKFYVNYMGIPAEQLITGEFLRCNPSLQFSFLNPKSKPRTFFGTILMGMSDSYSVLLRTWLFILIVTILMILLFKLLMQDAFHGFMESVGSSIVAFMFISTSTGLSLGICRNVKRLWLLSAGTRSEFLSSIEKHWFKQILIPIILFPAFFLISIYVVGFQYLSTMNFSLMMLCTILLMLVGFYFTLWIFSRDKDNKVGFSLVQMLMMAAQLVVLGGINAMLNLEQYAELIFVIGGLIIVIAVSRQKLFKKWNKINFVRITC